MHDLFRKVFNDKPKIEVNEDTGEINLSGNTLPIPEDIWLGKKKK